MYLFRSNPSSTSYSCEEVSIFIKSMSVVKFFLYLILKSIKFRSRIFVKVLQGECSILCVLFLVPSLEPDNFQKSPCIVLLKYVGSTHANCVEIEFGLFLMHS